MATRLMTDDQAPYIANPRQTLIDDLRREIQRLQAEREAVFCLVRGEEPPDAYEFRRNAEDLIRAAWVELRQARSSAAVGNDPARAAKHLDRADEYLGHLTAGMEEAGYGG